jgi:hypothetical protein
MVLHKGYKQFPTEGRGREKLTKLSSLIPIYKKKNNFTREKVYESLGLLRNRRGTRNDTLRTVIARSEATWQSHIDILFWSESSWVHSKALKTEIASMENKIGFLAMTSFQK